MKVFNPQKCSTTPRADMFLPNYLMGFGIFLDVLAVVCLITAFVTKAWGLIIGFIILGVTGIAAWLCWKNQSIRIVDENRFEYTTFLGKKTIYYFSDIKELRVNQDSFTLFVGNGKVHIESIVNISQKLYDKIYEALEKNRENYATNDLYVNQIERNNILIKKYIKIYLKRNLFLALFCAIICFIPLFSVSLIYAVLSYDLIVSFAPFPLALICVLISALPIIRFREMIEQQETLYNTSFSDDKVEHLETTLFLSEDWLIWAGSCALHKKHIQSIKYRSVSGRAGSSNKVTITTVNNERYVIWCLSVANIDKINAWRKS